MMKWLKKSLIITVALLTFGVITPTHDIWNGLQDKSNAKQTENPSTTQSDELQFGIAEPALEAEPVSVEEAFIVSAKELSYEKFGTKIGPVITTEFDEVIFPQIDAAIRTTLHAAEDMEKDQLAMSDRPAGNYSEKIFHLYDKENNKDLIQFHVRTDKRPQEGYFFNFHYHTAEDNFAAHHVIGEIYWSKDTPPKWLS